MRHDIQQRPVLVLGANGFLGKAVTHLLVSRGYKVRAFDRWTDGKPKSSSTLQVVTGDFTNLKHLSQAVEGVATVLHLVSAGNPAGAHLSTARDCEQNLVPTLHLLEAMNRAGVSRIIFASTGGALYLDDTRTHTEDDPVHPRSPYAITKLAIEHHLQFQALLNGVKYVILRISNPVGPGQKPGRGQGVIPIWLRLLRDSSPITLVGDGSATRDLVPSATVAEMVYRAVIREDVNNEIFNVGAGQSVTLAHALSLCECVAGVEAEVISTPTPPHYLKNVHLNVDKFRSAFGDLPEISLEKAVRHTWDSILQEAQQ